MKKILNLCLSVIACLMLTLSFLSCSKHLKESKPDKSLLLYQGKYDVILIDSCTFVFIPSTNSGENDQIKIYKSKDNKIYTNIEEPDTLEINQSEEQ